MAFPVTDDDELSAGIPCHDEGRSSKTSYFNLVSITIYYHLFGYIALYIRYDMFRGLGILHPNDREGKWVKSSYKGRHAC